MCRDELSIDYLGNVYDCDFNQMENRLAQSRTGEMLTVGMLWKLKFEINRGD
jgi:hypothetical protein